MTKFLRQTCSFEAAVRDEEGKPLLDKFGEIQYETSKTIRCRCERSTSDIQVADGAFLRSDTIYYIDGDTPINTDDKLDGKVVLTVSEYVNSAGRIEGYECHA